MCSGAEGPSFFLRFSGGTCNATGFSSLVDGNIVCAGSWSFGVELMDDDRGGKVFALRSASFDGETNWQESS